MFLKSFDKEAHETTKLSSKILAQVCQSVSRAVSLPEHMLHFDSLDLPVKFMHQRCFTFMRTLVRLVVKTFTSFDEFELGNAT